MNGEASAFLNRDQDAIAYHKYQDAITNYGERMEIAKLLMDGDKQAVILPKEFQFQGSEVYIKKIGNVIVLISKENPWKTLFDSLNLFSEDFMESREQPVLESREAFE